MIVRLLLLRTKHRHGLGLDTYLGLIIVVGVGGILAVLSLVTEIAAHRRNRSNVGESKLLAGAT